MNTNMLKIYVIPSNVDINNVTDYDPESCGKIFSTLTKINVNKISNGYSILYYSSDIKNMDMEVLGNNIIKLFMENVPNTIINISILYLYKIIDEDDLLYPLFDLKAINKLLSLESIFNPINHDETFMFNYIRSTIMDETIHYISHEYNKINNEDDDYEDDDDDDYGFMSDFFENLGIDHSDDDYDDEEEDDDVSPFDFLENNLRGYNPKLKNYKTKRVKGIPTSKVFRDAKNAKRSYNRHGVIICTDKDSRKRDKKIIKDFLKEFFPGDSEWKKNFRNDVLNRWMNMYCIAKKDLKELEKTHRKAKNAKRNYINTEKTLDFTRRLFNVPIDSWNDPNK